MFLISFFLCFFDFRQAGSSLISSHQQCIPQLHSWDAHGTRWQHLAGGWAVPMYSWSELCLMLHRRRIGHTVETWSNHHYTILKDIWRMQKFLHDFMIFGIGGLVDSPTSQALERIFGRDGMCVWPPLQSPCSFFQTLSCLDFLRNGILRVFCHRKVWKFYSCTCRFLLFEKHRSVFFQVSHSLGIRVTCDSAAKQDSTFGCNTCASPACRFSVCWSLGCKRNVPKQRRNHSSHAGYLSKGSRGVACVWTQPWPPGKEAWRNWTYLMIGDRYEPFEDQG